MPVTNQKPDSEVAEDVSALQENFKLKDKFRQTVSRTQCTVHTDDDDNDAGDVHGDDAARGGEAGQELPEETRGGQHWNCGPPGGEDGAGLIFCK